MRTHLRLFLDWGITFEKEGYHAPEHSARKVTYASGRELAAILYAKFPPPRADAPARKEKETTGGMTAPMQEETQQKMAVSAEEIRRKVYNTPKAEDTA